MENLHHCALTGDGAREFAVKYGFDICDPKDLITNDQKFTYENYVSTMEKCYRPQTTPKQDTQGYGDTVTAVAVDTNGHFACATSTGIIIICTNTLKSVLWEKAIAFGSKLSALSASLIYYVVNYTKLCALLSSRNASTMNCNTKIFIYYNALI